MTALKPPVVVTGAIIRDGQKNNEKILIAKRLATSKVEANKWEFPGGKVEGGEHPEACLKREIAEELGLEISVDRYFDLVSHVYPGAAHIVLLCYICHVTGGTLKLIEAADARWITRAELDDFDFALADLPLVARLKREWFSDSR